MWERKLKKMGYTHTYVRLGVNNIELYTWSDKVYGKQTLVKTEDFLQLNSFLPVGYALEWNGLKFAGLSDYLKEEEKPSVPVCSHPNKYKNIISANMQFWYCPDCGSDLGDV
jgi:hypothetical protein